MKGVLFVCVGNSGRSQLAEALARAMFGEQLTIQSAGLRPEPVNYYTGVVLHEIGIEIGNQYAKGLDSISMDAVDVMITLYSDDEGLRYGATDGTSTPSVRRLSWPIYDPADAAMDSASQLAAYRLVRDEIRTRLTRFDLNSI